MALNINARKNKGYSVCEIKFSLFILGKTTHKERIKLNQIK